MAGLLRGCNKTAGQFVIASARLQGAGRIFAIDTLPDRLDKGAGARGGGHQLQRGASGQNLAGTLRRQRPELHRGCGGHRRQPRRERPGGQGVQAARRRVRARTRAGRARRRSQDRIDFPFALSPGFRTLSFAFCLLTGMGKVARSLFPFMQVEVETLPNCITALRVELPPDRVDKERETILRDFQGAARLPGYRPGKAPKNLVETPLQEGDRRGTPAQARFRRHPRGHRREKAARPLRRRRGQVELGQDDIRCASPPRSSPRRSSSCRPTRACPSSCPPRKSPTPRWTARSTACASGWPSSPTSRGAGWRWTISA